MIGERVRLAREATRLTQQELATASGVPLGTLSGIEAGQVLNPSEEAVARIAKATLFPTHFFYLGPLPDLPEGYYRKLRRGTVKDSKQVRAHVRKIVEVIQQAESVLRLPVVTIEPVRDVSSPESIEEIASETRRALGLGGRDPIPNLTRAVERAGVVVVRLPLEMKNHDGFSAWPEFGLGRPIIALTGGHPGDRDRSNIGHEVGHLILHTLRIGTEPGRAEAEASRFSGALLLPREAAIEALRPPITLRVLMGVKATFGTSIAMNAQRGRELNLITQDHFVSLRKQLSARRWHRNEPVHVTPEEPRLMSKIVASLAGDGSTMERASRLGMPLFSFRALAG